MFSARTAKPEVSNTTILRPGTGARSSAMLRRASNSSHTPKAASALPRFGMPVDATSTGSLGETGENLTPLTTFPDDTVGPGGRESPRHDIRERSDGGRDEHDVGAAHRRGRVGGLSVDR